MTFFRKPSFKVALLIIHIIVVPVILLYTYIYKVNQLIVFCCTYIYSTALLVILLGRIDRIKGLYKDKRYSKLYKNIYRLLEMSSEIDDREDFFQAIITSAIDCVDSAQKGSIVLMDEETKKLRFVAAIGYDLEILKTTYLDIEDTYIYREVGGYVNKTIMVNDPFETDRNYIGKENISDILRAGTDDVMSTLSTPIFYKDHLYGFLNVESSHLNAFDQYDFEVIEIFAAEIKNVVKLFRSMEENKYYINYDIMTGIPNRKCIMDYLLEVDAKDHAEPYTVINIDLNELKEVNDHYGHDCGDEYLKYFTKKLMNFIPDNSMLGRYGGDEFLLVLDHCDSFRGKALMDEFTLQMQGQKNIKEDVYVTISFAYGIAVYGEDGDDSQTLIEVSDSRMYENKRLYYEKKKP